MRLEEEGEGDLSWDVVYRSMLADVQICVLNQLLNYVILLTR